MMASNFNQTEFDEFQYDDTGRLIKMRATLYLATLYVFICVLGLTGNAAVLCMIARSRRSKAVTNIYIFNLALADLLYAICLPAAICQMLNGQWTWGQIMCKLYYTCDGVSKFASVMFLVVLSCDRYLAVCHPIRCRSVRTPKLAFATTGLAWTIVILAMIPVFLYSGLIENSHEGSEYSDFQCVILWTNQSNQEFHDDEMDNNQTDHTDQTHAGTSSSRIIFTLYLFILSFLIPLAMVWIFYTMILLRLRQQKKRLFNTNVPKRKSTVTASETDHADLVDDEKDRQKKPMLPNLQARSATTSQRRGRSTRRVTIMVLSIVICYTVCWIPYWCVQITIEFNRSLVEHMNLELFTVISYIAYGMQSVNSMLNPFLYAFGTQTHRRCVFLKYPRFAFFGFRWRMFRFGSRPPKIPVPNERPQKCVGVEEGVLEAKKGHFLNPDEHAMPYLGIDQRRSLTISFADMSDHSGITNNSTGRRRKKSCILQEEPFFGYCLCCYCEKETDGSLVKTKNNSAANRRPTAFSSVVRNRGMSKDHYDDEEK